MNFGDQVIAFHNLLSSDWQLPKGFELIYPFDLSDTRSVFQSFYQKYFSDLRHRYYLFGINPGRFGAGITGIPFTDPKLLDEVCGISHPFDKRTELSSLFIYEMIAAMGGPKTFYQNFYITSVCPLGFTKEGKNINYYDDPKLQKAVLPRIISNIQLQIQFGCKHNIAFVIGQGANHKFLKTLNAKHNFFDVIIPLPHPRWVLQYRRKQKDIFLAEYVDKLNRALEI